jgi:hypothetical protein
MLQAQKDPLFEPCLGHDVRYFLVSFQQ